MPGMTHAVSNPSVRTEWKQADNKGDFIKKSSARWLVTQDVIEIMQAEPQLCHVGLAHALQGTGESTSVSSLEKGWRWLRLNSRRRPIWFKSHSQLPMYNTAMEGKVEGKVKLSQKGHRRQEATHPEHGEDVQWADLCSRQSAGFSCPVSRYSLLILMGTVH